MTRSNPNIVLILTDDQGWGDLSRCGNRQIATPHIDRLAAQGATFDRFFVQPLCAPTRAEILTGRQFPRTGVKGVSRCAERLNTDETTMADVFGAAGYATGCFGKWHSGLQYPYHPNARGFDEFYGFCCGHWSHYFDTTIERNGVETRAPGYLPDALTSEAIAFIEQHRDRPFFCYVPLNTPHSPFQVPDAWYARFAAADLPQRATEPDRENLAETRAALAMCENIDWNVGRLTAVLTRLELAKDTIVIYLSDNGPNTWRWNGGMAGKKGSCREGGVRSPCSMTWPGRIPARHTVHQIAGAIDLLPTLTALADINLPTTRPLDGRDLSSLLRDGAPAADWPDRHLFALEVGGYDGSYGRASVRDRRFRAYEDGRLYEPAVDPGEDRDLSMVHAAQSRYLRRTLAAWKDALPRQPIHAVLPVGYPEFPHTYLPAQDATPGGDVTWSSVHPNCSWFTNWHNGDDVMTWDIAVRTAGRYRVTAMIACPAPDVGSTIAVRFAGRQVNARITEPFDPPLKDKDDRVPRTESYEKEFTPLLLGELLLPATRGDLVLGCLEKAGATVCEVRALKLELVPPA